MSNKLRYWVKLDASGVPVGGSNVNRPKKPVNGRWIEVDGGDCCGPVISVIPSFPITDTVVTLLCDASPVFVSSSTYDFTTMVNLINYLNNNVSSVGVFSAVGTAVHLHVKKKLAKSICASGTVTMTIA